jgi:hypothetical protein
MNCQDVARLLDEKEVDGLLAAGHSELQAHLATCADCAREWRIFIQLAGEDVPAVPAEMRALYAAQPGLDADARARRRSRFVVIGTLFAVAAAAAMLVVQVTESVTPVAASGEGSREQSSAVQKAPPVSAPAISPVDNMEQMEQPPVPADRTPAVTSASAEQLRIVVMPTRHDSADKLATPAIDAFYLSLLQALRNMPGITVDVAGGTTAEDKALNRVTVVSPRFTSLTSGDRVYYSGGGEYNWSESGAFRGPQRWFVEVMLQPAGTPQSRGATYSSVYQYLDGSGNPSGGMCGGVGAVLVETPSASMRNFSGPAGSGQPLASCATSADKLAARIVAALRPQPAPSASDADQFIARLKDASLTSRDRSSAFSDLLGRLRQSGVSLDAAAIDTITAYIASLPPDQRETSLLIIRGVRRPGLVGPLIEFMMNDEEAKVRLGALSTLTRDYGSDSRTRVALEAVVRQDASRLLRMVAQRALSGDAQWQPYVVATLLDRSLSIPDRLAPAQYEAGLANFPEGFEKMQSYLGSREATSQLLDIIQTLRNQAREPAREPASGGFGGGQGTPFGFRGGNRQQDEAIQSVAGLLSVTNPSAAIDVWISILTESPQPRTGLTGTALNKLMEKRDDPRVSKLFDDIGAGKLGPELRDAFERNMATRAEATVRPEGHNQ